MGARRNNSRCTAAAAFRLATEAGIRFASGVTAADPRVTLIGESVSAVVATALWAYW